MTQVVSREVFAIERAKARARECDGKLFGLQVEKVVPEEAFVTVTLSWLVSPPEVPLTGLIPWLRKKIHGPPPMERVFHRFEITEALVTMLSLSRD